VVPGQAQAAYRRDLPPGRGRYGTQYSALAPLRRKGGAGDLTRPDQTSRSPANSARNAGSAIWISARARSASIRPRSSTIPCSVTTRLASARGVVAAPTPYPSDRLDNRRLPAVKSDGAPPSTSPMAITVSPVPELHNPAVRLLTGPRNHSRLARAATTASGCSTITMWPAAGIWTSSAPAMPRQKALPYAAGITRSLSPQISTVLARMR